MTIDPDVLEQVYMAPVEERLAIIDAIRSSIEHEAHPPSPAFVAFILDRQAQAEATPGHGQSWDDVEAEIFAELGL